MFWNQAWIKSHSIFSKNFLKSKNSHALLRFDRPVMANGAPPPTIWLTVRPWVYCTKLRIIIINNQLFLQRYPYIREINYYVRWELNSQWNKCWMSAWVLTMSKRQGRTRTLASLKQGYIEPVYWTENCIFRSLGKTGGLWIQFTVSTVQCTV